MKLSTKGFFFARCISPGSTEDERIKMLHDACTAGGSFANSRRKSKPSMQGMRMSRKIISGKRELLFRHHVRWASPSSAEVLIVIFLATPSLLIMLLET